MNNSIIDENIFKFCKNSLEFYKIPIYLQILILFLIILITAIKKFYARRAEFNSAT